jgi:surface antigen
MRSRVAAAVCAAAVAMGAAVTLSAAAQPAAAQASAGQLPVLRLSQHVVRTGHRYTATIISSPTAHKRRVWLESKDSPYWEVLRQVQTRAGRIQFQITAGARLERIKLRAVVGRSTSAPVYVSVTSATLGVWSLGPGAFLTSPNGQYRLTMQSDGNLVESVTSSGRALWTSGTGGHPDAYAAVYDHGLFYVMAGATTLWSAGPYMADADANWHVTLQNDGNLVLYDSSTAYWADGVANTQIAPLEMLRSGWFAQSPDGHYRLTMQADGNLVENVSSSKRPIWSSGTAGHSGAYVVQQTDGNLVIYQGNAALWSTVAAGSGTTLQIQNDSNLVQYRSGAPTWASSTVNDLLAPDELLSPGQVLYSKNGTYLLAMQGDGNLVQYKAGSPTWSSGTAGHPGAFVVMQGDGNLVVYQGSTPLWSSNTAGHPGAFVANQEDGNIVVYAGTTPLWASHSANPTGYPWVGAPCAFGSAGGASCANPSNIQDRYDWYWDENQNGHLDGNCSNTPYSGECFDQWGYEYRNCTSYVAWKLSQRGYNMPFGIGNANNWDNYYTGRVAINGSPAVGAIAQTDAGGFGHVAYVEAYNATSVTVSEFNWAGTGAFDLRTVPIGTFQYIHV